MRREDHNLSNRFSPGQIIAGKYRVSATLGRGRGVLLLAEHVSFEQKVAIRVVSPAAADRDSLVKFEREARALAKLGSEHVARIIDVGTLDDGSLYLVRQYLDGVELAAHLRSSGKLSVDAALSYILQATEAVAETHAYGILIRELTPERLFLANRSPGIRGGRPVLKITDLGTAKLLDDESPAPGEENTNTAVLGLSPYSSPEALRRQRDIDVRTDVWSLGAILYHMLGGRPPFGVDVVSLAVAITRDEPVDLCQLSSAVPPELAAAVRQALAKDKQERTADTHGFAASIARFAPPEGKVLMERIRELASSARIKMGQGEEEELEVSQFEEIDDAPTGQATHEEGKEQTSRTAATSFGPLRGHREQTEALGFSFIPSDPLTGSPSSRPPAAGISFGPRPSSVSPSVPPAAMQGEPTQMLGWNVTPAESTGRIASQQLLGSSPLPPPLGAVDSSALPPNALLSQALRKESWRAPPDLAGPMTFGPPQDETSFGRKLAMYAFGGAIAAIIILSLVLAALYVIDR